MGATEKPSAPEVPSVTETSAQSIQAQIDALPKILEAQQKYGPEFAQQELEMLRQFGPEAYAAQVDLEKKYGPEVAQLTRDLQGILAPERVAGQDVLKQYLSQQDLLTPEEVRTAQGDIRSAQSVRGMGESGMGALDELRQLTELRQQLKTRQLNTALSSAGLMPGASGMTTALPNVNTGNLVQNVSPSDIFGLQSNIYSNLTSQYGQNMQYKLGQQQIIGDIIGGTISAGGTVGAAAIAASSRDYKENIQPSNYDSEAIVKGIEVVTFNYKPEYGDDRERVGFIAEDVPDILTTENKKAVDLYNTIGILVDLNKKLLTRIEKLEGVA